VLEQCVRITAVFILSDTLMQKGIEFACAGAVIGMVAGEILAFVFTGICYIVHLGSEKSNSEPQISVVSAVGILCAMALPLTLNRVFSSLISTAENILIPQRLQIYGLTRSEALEIYGKLFGMAMPLVMFPSSLLTALSTTMLPAISEGHTLKQKSALTSAIQRCVMLTSVIGMGTAAVFVAYPTEIGQIIYKTNIASMLRLVGLMCPFLYIQVMFSGILNGFGEQLFIFKTGLMSGIINLIFIYFLTPVMGISAFYAGWMISTVITSALSALRIQHYTVKPLNFLHIGCKPLLSAALAALASYLLRNKLYGLVNLNMCILISIAAMGIVYLAILYISDYQNIK
jgi:stage V sporulation protein B